MKNKKGFTLIEIIVAIALLGIISVGMLSGMTSEFSLLKDTQKITEDVSSVQQRMELEISEIKKAVQNGGTPEDRTLYTLFTGANQRNIYGYPREFEISIGKTLRSLFTIIADNRMPEFQVASTTIGIEFSNGNTLKYAYKDTPSLYVKSTTQLNDPDNVNLTNIYRWYVARKGFYMPVISNPTEIENGTKYPRFPDDYTIIPGANTTNITNIAPSYMGRHLICTVTPAAKSGKMGATAVSNAVLLSGLPVIDDLGLHLDASFIPANSVSVDEWEDISGRGEDAETGTTSREPELKEKYVGDFIDKGIQYETHVRYLEFDSNDKLTAKIYSLDPTKVTVFVVAKVNGNDDTKFMIYENAGYGDLVEGSKVSKYSNDYNIDIGNLRGSYTHADIAEVIIYKKNLTENEFDLVVEYLENKYNPVESPLTIQFIPPISVNLLVGDDYPLPTVVPAIMSNKQTKNVSVSWTSTKVDTTTTGVISYQGTATTDGTKKTVLTATIVANTVSFNINSASVTVVAPVGEATPNTASEVETATSNADYTVTNVVWNEALSSGKFISDIIYTTEITLTSKNGKKFQMYPFTPSVAGATSVTKTITSGGDVVGNTVTFTATFPKALPPILIINSAEIIMEVPVAGEERQSVSEIQGATNADYFTITGVTWSPDNSTFASNQIYTATITLKSKDGRKFQLSAFTPTVPGSTSVTSTTTSGGDVVGNTVTFSVTFPTTLQSDLDLAIAQLGAINLVVTNPTDNKPTISLQSGYTWSVTGNGGSLNGGKTIFTASRPAWYQSDRTATLTARTTVGGIVISRTFVVTVPRESWWGANSPVSVDNSSTVQVN